MRAIQPPALLYHKILPDWEVGVTWVTPGAFRRQVELAWRAGWRTWLPGEEPDGDRRFLLAFDDGYESVFSYAYPELSRLDYRALVFIPSGYLGSWNDWDHQLLRRRFRHLNSSMLVELLGAGWKVGSHGATHRALTVLGDRELEREVVDSKKALEDRVGERVEWLAFPFGRYDERVVRSAVRAGYAGAITPALNRRCRVDEFVIWEADAVYLWNSAQDAVRLLNRDPGYRLSRAIRCTTNLLSGGTMIWRQLFPPVGD